MLEFNRTYSLFQPEFTYNVVVNDPALGNMRIGAVARNANNLRKWWASDKTWSGGGDLARTFPTRWQAAEALLHIHNGHPPESVGGYYVEPTPEEKE